MQCIPTRNENKNALYKAIIEEEDDVACVILTVSTLSYTLI